MAQPKSVNRQQFYHDADEQMSEGRNLSLSGMKDHLGLFAFIMLGLLFVLGVGVFAVYGFLTFVSGT